MLYYNRHVDFIVYMHINKDYYTDDKFLITDDCPVPLSVELGS